jgi:predicted PurR-regulated permease PerM
VSQSAVVYDPRHRRWIVGLAIAITIVFLFVIRSFVITVLLAAIAAGLATPLYDWLRDSPPLRRLRRPQNLATVLTLLLVLLVILVPLIVMLGIVADQAIGVSQNAIPWIQEQATRPDAFDALIDRVPVLEPVRPYKARVLEKVGELAGALSAFLARQLANLTRGAVVFVFHLFVMLYAMFFLLRDGRALLARLRTVSPLPAEDKQRLLDRFVSVSRATLKGTLVIGLVQGVLGGLALWAAGIPSPVFWAAMIVVLSCIPGVGSAIVWIPAFIYLMLAGRGGVAVAFAVWFILVVGLVDNFLRPWLVGQDTELPDLLILLSTLGGIAALGPAGLIIGPIVAALFVTIWDIFDVAFERGRAGTVA